MSVPVVSLVEGLRQAPFLDASQKAELARLEVQFPRPRDLAQELVRRGWLTHYQATQLLQGKGQELLLGQYILLDKLGEGGMGQVYKARQRNLDRVVALKVIRKECLDNPRVISRFQREIRAAGQLSHPNIVHAYDADQVNGSYYIAMEYIDGADLAQLVKEHGPLAVDQACEFIRQAALGLQHAYERGLVHRDIKPGNLLVSNYSETALRGFEPTGKYAVPAGKRSDKTRSGVRSMSGVRKLSAAANAASDARPLTPNPCLVTPVVKLLDLGLARWEDPATGQASTHLTQMGSVMGTPDFIAPEQARNSHTCDIRADLYSLGCTLYYLIAGRVPFVNGSLPDKLIQHQMDEPEPLADVRRTMLISFHSRLGATKLPRRLLHVPEPVESIVKKLMAKRPEDRYQTPADLALALEQALERMAQGPEPRANDPAECETLPPALLFADPLPMAEPLPHDGPLVQVATVHGLKRRQRWSRRRWLSLGTIGTALFLGLVLAVLNGNHAKPEASDQKAPADAADSAAWQALQAEVRQQKLPADELRAKLLDFRRQHPARAREVAALLQQLPSPFEAFERAKIDVKLWYAWMPEELVGILGMWRGFPIGRAGQNVAVSPDGKWIVGTAEDRAIRVWDTSAPTVPWRLDNQAWVRIGRVAIAPGGILLAAACDDGAVRMYDLKIRALLHTLDTQRRRPITCVAFHPDGGTLASAGHDGIVRLWNLATTTAPPIEIQANTDQVHALAFAPDGKHVFWGGKNQDVYWTDAAGQNPKDWKFASDTGAVKVLAFHPDGHTLVCGGSDGSLRLCSWNGQQVRARATLAQHSEAVNGAAFAPDGQSFVTVSDDKHAILWDAATGAATKTWELRSPIHGVAFAPDSRHILLANANGTIYVLRLAAATDVAKAK